MRAIEFLTEVSMENLAKTPVGGGQTLGDAVAQKMRIEDPVAALDALSQADPTMNNSMTRWLARIYLNNESNFRVPEDNAQILDDLTKYMKLKNAKKLDSVSANIENLKSLNALYDVIEKFDDVSTLSGKETKKKVKQEGVDFIINDPKFAVVHTKTHEANCFYGAGTKWCTASKSDSGFFDQYSGQGPIYTVLDNSGAEPRKFQYHYESGQFLNERDQTVSDQDIAQLSKNPGWAKFLNLEIKKHYGDIYKLLHDNELGAE